MARVLLQDGWLGYQLTPEDKMYLFPAERGKEEHFPYNVELDVRAKGWTIRDQHPGSLGDVIVEYHR